MAGILNQSRYTGVLSQEDKQQAAYQGLAAMGAQLMEAGAPSTTPQGLGGVGKGLLAFTQAQSKYGDTLFNRRLNQMQMVKLEREDRKDQDLREAIDTLARAPGGLDPATGINWKPLAPGVVDAAMARIAPGQFVGRRMMVPTAPTVKNFQVDDQIVPHQYNPKTGQWESIPDKGGPRWEITRQGLTSNQERTNNEINSARSYIEEAQLTHKQLMEQTQPTNSQTLLPNPNYNRFLAQQARLANRRLFGEDPDYGRFQKILLGDPNPPNGQGDGGVATQPSATLPPGPGLEEAARNSAQSQITDGVPGMIAPSSYLDDKPAKPMSAKQPATRLWTIPMQLTDSVPGMIAPSTPLSPQEQTTRLNQARAAIQNGAPPDGVNKILLKMGIDPSGL